MSDQLKVVSGNPDIDCSSTTEGKHFASASPASALRTDSRFLKDMDSVLLAIIFEKMEQKSKIWE